MENRTPLEEEYAALTREAGLVDLGQRTLIEVAGSDRAGFLNRFTTNKVDNLAGGEGREAFLTDAKGHVLAWVLVLARPDCLVLDADPGCAEKILSHLNYYLIREDVAFADRSRQWAELMLAGPRAEQMLEKLTAALPPSGHLAHLDTILAERPASLCRVDLGGRPTVWIRCAGDDAAPVRQAILASGARACGREAAEAVRIECGWPQYGRDVTEENLPQEVGRDKVAISFQKGCYVGQETVARLDALGHVNKRLMGLRLSGDRLPPDGTPLSASGRPAGKITSSAHGLGEVVSLGYVRREFDQPGMELTCPQGAVRVVALGEGTHDSGGCP